MSDLSARLCPQCFHDLHALFGIETAQKLTFCPQCQFPLALLAGKYRLEKQIGQGGFGKVYLARHVNLQRDQERVVKILNAEIFKLPGMEERFFREVQVTGSVARNCDHIVRIYDDFGKHPQVGYFYVMEYLQGQPLSDLLQPPGHPLPIALVMHIFGQLCEAIDTAHQEGVIHRDLKPDNIFLIQRKQDRAFIKVLDFGIAKPMDSTGIQHTQLTHGVMGTPLYMSPEQWANQPIDARIDIYAMGLILYQMLAGCLPFAMDLSEMSMQDLVAAHLHQTPLPLTKAAPHADIPTTFEPIVMKALEKNPADRHPSAKAFWQALENALPLAHTQELTQDPTDIGLLLTGVQSLLMTSPKPSPSPKSGHERIIEQLPTGDSSPEVILRETHPPQAQVDAPAPTQMALWLTLSLASCALLLGALWWWLQSKPTTPPPKQHTAATRTKHPKPDTTSTLSQQPRSPKHTAGTPTPPIPTTQHQCPTSSPDLRWILLTLPQTPPTKIQALDGKPPITKQIKVPGGVCCSIKKATSFQLTAPAHSPCYFPIKFQNATMHIQLKPSSFNDIEPAPDYCIKSEPESKSKSKE